MHAAAPQPNILAPIPPLARALAFVLRPETNPRDALKRLQSGLDPKDVIVGVGEPLARAIGRTGGRIADVSRVVRRRRRRAEHAARAVGPVARQRSRRVVRSRDGDRRDARGRIHPGRRDRPVSLSHRSRSDRLRGRHREPEGGRRRRGRHFDAAAKAVPAPASSPCSAGCTTSRASGAWRRSSAIT